MIKITTVFLLFFIALLQYCNSQDFHCCDGAVRLSDGSLANEGRVEICQSGEWKTVCDNNWSQNEARVVCRQLGYTTQGTVPLIAFGRGTGTIVEQVRCNGTERGVAECTMRDVLDGECNHNEDAGVRCSCRNGDVRLEGSTILGRGRVEVCINSVWGTICDNSWNTSTVDANVVCSQLGFSRVGAIAYCCATDGQGSGPIHMNNVGCRGNELSLIDCPYSTNHNCHHGEDASVQCRTRIVCYDGDVRLVGGRQPYEGRVEICFNETWGTICQWISPFSWNHSQADIVCHQLGYSQAESSTYSFGRGTTPINIAHVDCKGTESSLDKCAYSTRQSCLTYSSTHRIIGVRCRLDIIERGTLRLTDGYTHYDGRVEIFWNSEWQLICSDEWDEMDATVICRQLGYLPTSLQIHALSYDYYHHLNKLMLISNVGCDGSESSLTTCCSTILSNSIQCHSQNYAGVRCSQCIENSIQLVGDLSQHEGTPVICLGGSWARVCGASTHAAATAVVACRQLGFSAEDPAVQSIFASYFGLYSRDHIGLSFSIIDVLCNSSETQLSQCEYTVSSGLSLFDCILSTFKIGCKISRGIVPGAPQNLKISNHYAAMNSSVFNLTLTWFPPPLSEIYGLTISTYIINCTNQMQLDSIIRHTDTLSVTFPNLFSSYNCCIAAVSNHGRGKLACITATEEDSISSVINVQRYNQVPLVATASMLGLLSLILLVVAIVAGVYISYRLCKHDKNVVSNMPGHIPVYEMVDLPTSGNSSSHEQEDTNTDQLILKQEQAKGFPHEYLTPTISKRADQGQSLATNTYQPLIPPQLVALGDDKSEYQSLTQKTSIAPPKFGVAPMKTAPPVVPSKPKGI